MLFIRYDNSFFLLKNTEGVFSADVKIFDFLMTAWSCGDCFDLVIKDGKGELESSYFISCLIDSLRNSGVVINIAKSSHYAIWEFFLGSLSMST